MPHADIKSKQAVLTLSQLHAELAGKFAENRNAGVKIKTAMMQVEAVLQMLQPSFDVRSISAKRPQQEQSMVQARDAVSERDRCATASWHSDHGAGDCRRPDSRESPSGHAQASDRPTGGYSLSVRTHCSRLVARAVLTRCCRRFS